MRWWRPRGPGRPDVHARAACGPGRGPRGPGCPWRRTTGIGSRQGRVPFRGWIAEGIPDENRRSAARITMPSVYQRGEHDSRCSRTGFRGAVLSLGFGCLGTAVSGSSPPGSRRTSIDRTGGPRRPRQAAPAGRSRGTAAGSPRRGRRPRPRASPPSSDTRAAVGGDVSARRPRPSRRTPRPTRPARRDPTRRLRPTAIEALADRAAARCAASSLVAHATAVPVAHARPRSGCAAGGQRAGGGEQHLAAAAGAARSAAARVGSSSENTSSSSSTGGAPISVARRAGGRPGAAPAPASAARPATRGCARRQAVDARARGRRGGARPSVTWRRTSSARAVAKRGGQPVAAPRRLVAAARPAAGAPATLRVGLADQRRRSSVEQRRPRRGQAPRRPSASLASHTSSVAARLSVAEPAAGLLQQRVALPEDALEVGAQRVVLRAAAPRARRRGTAGARRAALDEREVVGREHRDPEHAEQVAGPRQALAVDQHAVATGRARSRPRQQLAPVVARPRRARWPVGARADQRSVGRARKLSSVRQVADRLDEVRLALAVVADAPR